MNDLARLLADGRWHSGSTLAQTLGISRAAVWKRIDAARDRGLVIDAVRGRGYRMRQPYEPLEAEAIGTQIAADTHDALADLEVLAAVDSTNSRLLARAEPGAAACFAEHQTGGRGRRGRSWASPFGANLYFSVAWPYDPAPAAIGALGLAVGASLAGALHDSGIAGIGLKWPNDLVVDDVKLGGILVEHRGEAAGGCRIVVGVGLNVAMDPAQARDIDQAWTSVAAITGTTPQRNPLAARLLDASVRALRQFGAEGFSPFRRTWARFDAVTGRDVWLQMDRECVAGVAAGIAADGALQVDTAEGRRRFYTGDVSLRLR